MVVGQFGWFDVGGALVRHVASKLATYTFGKRTHNRSSLGTLSLSKGWVAVAGLPASP